MKGYSDSEIEYLNGFVKKYQEKKLSLQELIDEVRGVSGFWDEFLLENIEIFKEREDFKALSQAVLDGAHFYTHETTEEYLKAGLDKETLIEWLKDFLPVDWCVDAGAEDEMISCDRVVLELCQILKKYGFDTETIKSVLNSLSEDAKVFFVMVEQRDEWQEIGINPEEYNNRYLEYVKRRCKEKASFDAGTLYYNLKNAPSPLREKCIKMIFKHGAIKTQEIIEFFNKPSKAVKFLKECGINESRLAELLIRDVGSDYEKYSKKAIDYAYWLLPEANEILDEKEINRIWRNNNPSTSSWSSQFAALFYDWAVEDGYI